MERWAVADSAVEGELVVVAAAAVSLAVDAAVEAALVAAARADAAVPCPSPGADLPSLWPRVAWSVEEPEVRRAGVWATACVVCETNDSSRRPLSTSEGAIGCHRSGRYPPRT